MVRTQNYLTTRRRDELAAIAKTAGKKQSELKTLNRKHYPMLKGLRPAYTK